jgi:tetratricopeptide (TPR) repeat protein
MTANPRVEQLLDELADSQSTPEEVCRSCPELLPEVRSRWQAVRRVEAELDMLFPAPAATPSDNSLPRLGRTTLPPIPGYEVEGIIGSGGMGVVYRAHHLALDRKVAIKMLLAGAFAGPNERARFRREAESLAGLRHTNIVQVYDAGEVADHPYFAMEFVEGGSLANRPSATPLPARQAAELTATLARAVQFAHDAGIVHRDLKPANILLSSDGTPKITDFGLAVEMVDGTRFTMSGARLGTPSYMAPEQALGKSSAIGPAVDIYALGAVLYELLTGRPPFRGETPAETERRVIAEEPIPPSRLNATIPRDLETICLKCLEKVPQRRYRSAGELADDLDRFLAGRPIQARPLGRGERFWRWCRRYPMAVALCLVLLASAVISSLQAVRAKRAEAEANAANEQAQKRLKQVEKANELLGSIFENLDPKEIAKSGIPLQAILVKKLDRAVEQLEGESIGDPQVVATMQGKFALSLLALSEPAKAIVLLEKAHATRESELGQDDPLTLASAYDLALAYKAAGKLDRALELQQQTWTRMKAVLGPNHPDTLKSMESVAAIDNLLGKRDLSLLLFEETLRLRKTTLGPNHPHTLITMNNLAMAYLDAERSELALPLFEQTYAARKTLFRPTDPETLDTMSKLAMTYEALGKMNLAQPLFEQTLELRKKTLGPEHADTLLSMYGLATFYETVGKPKLALPLIAEVLRIKKARLGAEDPETRRTVNRVDFLTNLVTAHDRYEQNLAKFGPDHIDTLLARRDIAQFDMTMNRLEEAEQAFVEILNRMKGRPNDDPIVVFTIRLLNICRVTRERSAPDSWLTFNSESLLGGVYMERKNYAAAEPLLVGGYQGMKQREAKIPANAKARLAEAVKRLVQVYEANGKPAEAAKWRKVLDAEPR